RGPAPEAGAAAAPEMDGGSAANRRQCDAALAHDRPVRRSQRRVPPCPDHRTGRGPGGYDVAHHPGEEAVGISPGERAGRGLTRVTGTLIRRTRRTGRCTIATTRTVRQPGGRASARGPRPPTAPPLPAASPPSAPRA